LSSDRPVATSDCFGTAQPSVQHGVVGEEIRERELTDAAEFDGKKIVVVGGSAGMARQAAPGVIDRGGSAVIIGCSKSRVDQTAAQLTERSAVAEIRGALSGHRNHHEEHL
jgi:cation diffusion facilitator CzcD-associated flavoprotein CzcO